VSFAYALDCGGFEDVAGVGIRIHSAGCTAIFSMSWTHVTGLTCAAVRGKRKRAAPMPPTMAMFRGRRKPDIVTLWSGWEEAWVDAADGDSSGAWVEELERV